jgi:acyl-coenzyme A synthetase/AMP-(fatty) acid ligase
VAHGKRYQVYAKALDIIRGRDEWLALFSPERLANDPGARQQMRELLAPLTRRRCNDDDALVLDEAGELYIVGRSKSVIFQGGLTIAPQEIEETIDGLPFVRRSAAVGVDRGRIEGEQVYLFSELTPVAIRQPEQWQELAAATVRAFNQRMGFRPGRVYLMRTSSIPMRANGKIRHRELRRQYLSGELREAGRTLFPEY